MFLTDFYHPLLAAFLGGCFGSFINVILYRFPLGKSIVYPGSACPKCNHTLAWYDNVPVLGWLWLLGKCRYCRNPISIRYPLNEALYALICGLAVWFHPLHAWPKGLGLAILGLHGLPMTILLVQHRRAPWYLIVGSLAGSILYLLGHFELL
ncbi:Prepilin peptidase [Sulfidibacter corallicola]|uniref:Prepilin peptidase n=1 Tax=Sulfidibacter corallicola TaxID=2818388 RepID=A0A8A4TGD1_SULCO|nr:prepilin peptidase [Sulfidibacter corallicola]QTD47841.1 prepilin peptidase [Sulfidibacter corallicola]